LDTVGAVCVDYDGGVAATCSSGGILLKLPGRVGQAGVYGCGCWAENSRVEKEWGVAVTVSGCGEDLIKTCLAKETALALKQCSCPTIALNDTIRHRFLESPFIGSDSQKLCGVIGVQTSGNSGEFVWAHTTESMGIGYMTTEQVKPKVVFYIKNCVVLFCEIPSTTKNYILNTFVHLTSGHLNRLNNNDVKQ
ncbi:hypothetical protein AAG570_008712, partial [Ranatra chinensis]